MAYKVIKGFADLQDKEHVYVMGDTFPRDGLTVTDERISELSSGFNKIGEPLIEHVDDQKTENLDGQKNGITEEQNDPVEAVKKPRRKGK